MRMRAHTKDLISNGRQFFSQDMILFLLCLSIPFYETSKLFRFPSFSFGHTIVYLKPFYLTWAIAVFALIKNRALLVQYVGSIGKSHVLSYSAGFLSIVWLFSSSLHSGSTKYTHFLFFINYSLLFILPVFIRTPRQISLCLLALSLGSILYSLNLFFLKIDEGRNIYSMALPITLLFTTYLTITAFQNGTKKRGVVSLSLTLLTMWLLGMTLSQASYVAFIPCFLLFYSWGRRSHRWIGISLVMICFLMMCLSYERFLHEITSTARILFFPVNIAQAKDLDPWTFHYSSLWIKKICYILNSTRTIAWRAFFLGNLSSVWLYGKGIQAIVIKSGLHNTYLSLWYAGGFPCLVFFLTMLGGIITCVRRSIKYFSAYSQGSILYTILLWGMLVFLFRFCFDTLCNEFILWALWGLCMIPPSIFQEKESKTIKPGFCNRNVEPRRERGGADLAQKSARIVETM